MDWTQARRVSKDEIPKDSTLVNVNDNPNQPNGAIGVMTDTFQPFVEHGGTVRGYFWVIPPKGSPPFEPKEHADKSGLVQIVVGPEGHMVDPKLHTHWDGQW